MPGAQLGSLSGPLTPDPPALAVLAHRGTGCAHRSAAAFHPAQSWGPQGPRRLRAQLLGAPPRPGPSAPPQRPEAFTEQRADCGQPPPCPVAPLPSVCLGPAGVRGEICSLVRRPSHRPRPAAPGPSAGESSECGPDGRGRTSSGTGAAGGRRQSARTRRAAARGRWARCRRAASEALGGPAEKSSVSI